MPPPAAAFRELHLRWLLELTQIPTAAGREQRAVEWISTWASERPDLALTTDAAGNLTIAPKAPARSSAGAGPILFTAHLDHPAFVVERIVAPGVLELAFRGGVMDPYFDHALVAVHTADYGGKPPLRATLSGLSPGPGPFKKYLADTDPTAPQQQFAAVRIGDIATWDLPPAEIDAQGRVHTHACDDLAAAAAALAAFDVLRSLRASGQPTEDVRLLFTRAEEIGFIGAIGACRLGTIPPSARVIALENSRSFADSPIGGGPIVRVGDRLSVFDPRLTAACARKAEQVASAEGTAWRWQRKLMPGGACEASVFCAYAHQATCLCLPLGNYHNMADLAAVQDGSYNRETNGPPRVAREFIHRDDYSGLIDLLVAIGTDLPEADPAIDRFEKLYQQHANVLSEPSGASRRA